jgi:hypothetical protein
MAEVEILEVVPTPLDTRNFWGGSIDLPVAGERRKHYALVMGGWVASRHTDDLDVEVLSEGRRVARWRADQPRPDVAATFPDLPVNSACGFMGVIRTIELPPSFTLEVEVVGRYHRGPLGLVRGRRSPLLADVDEPLRAAPVVTLGRTGSTLLLLLLGQHPQLLVHPPFPYETRVLTYWLSVFEGLSSPTSYLQALAPVDTRRYWWVGYDRFATETYVDQDAAAQRLGGAALEVTARFANRQVAGFYEVSAAAQRKPLTAPGYFVEKQLPDPVLLGLQAELFPRRREIYLTRDFRDMMTSIAAFNEKRGSVGFSRAESGNDDSYVAEQGRAVDKLLDGLKRAGDRGLLVRYEDLVGDRHASLRRILEFLGVDSSAEVIDGMIRSAELTDPDKQAAHRTAADGLRTIGRWRTELPPGLRDRCQAAFADALVACGYET